MLNFFQKQSFGLNIGDSSLKIAKIEKRGKEIRLASYSEQNIPKGVLDCGEIKKPDELARIIKKAVSETKISPLKTNYCNVSLPETEAFIRIIQLPLMKKEEIQEAIQWEAESNIPLSLDEVYLDWQKIEENKQKQNILIGAIPKKIADSYMETLKKAGLNPIGLETESMATVRALVPNGFSEKPIMVIDFGEEKTNFIIFFKSTIYFTTSIPLGNKNLIENMAQFLNGDNEKNKNLNKKKSKENPYESISSFFNDTIVKKANEYLAYFQNHYVAFYDQPSQVSKIILAGSGASLANLAECLTAGTKIEAKIGNPWTNILKSNNKDVPEMPYDKSLTYSTAFGLALKTLENNNQNLDCC